MDNNVVSEIVSEETLFDQGWSLCKAVVAQRELG